MASSGQESASAAFTDSMSGSDVAERIREIAAAMKAVLKKLNAVDVSEQRASSRLSVRQLKLVNEMFSHVGRALDLMEKMESKTMRIVFQDCELIASMRAMVSAANDMLMRTQLGEKTLVPRFLKQCDVIEQVLKDMGLKARLEEAHRQAAKDMQEAEAKQAPRLKKTTTAEFLLRTIDDIDQDNSADTAIDELYAFYQTEDGAGVSGKAYDDLVDLVTKHVERESIERAERLGRASFAQSAEQIKGHVLSWLDPNRDGTISKQEAKYGLVQAVNDIDPRDEVAKRRRKLDEKLSANNCTNA